MGFLLHSPPGPKSPSESVSGLVLGLESVLALVKAWQLALESELVLELKSLKERELGSELVKEMELALALQPLLPCSTPTSYLT